MADNSRYKPNEGDDKEEDDDEQIDDSGYKTVKDAVLFAIDISDSMLKKPEDSTGKKEDTDSPALAALKCAYQLMQQRIISNPNDMMGILLFGTEQSKFSEEESMTYPNCYILSDLDVPAAADVKRLRNLVEEEQEASNLLVPSKSDVSLGNVLFCANRIFTTRAPNFSSRRLFLVTDNDQPHTEDKQLRSAAAVRAKDLYDLGVIIELFPIARPDTGFDRSRFYDDIVYRNIPNDPEAPAPISHAARASKSGDGISLLQSLLSSISSKAAPRRALFSLPFEIGPGLKIGIKGYILIKRQEVVRSCYIWTGGEKLQIAVGATSQLAEDSARKIEKVEIKRAFTFGGEKIIFTDEELKKVRHLGDPLLRVIGFKPLSMLPIWASYRASMFVYPDDADFIGSTRTFSALQQNMLKKEKFALCWFIPRRNATPVLAAAIPGAEKLDDEGNQITPPGLWLVPLPTADDIRQNPDTELVRAPDSLVDLMRVVVQQLMLPKQVYDPKKYPNPHLQWFYRVLQSLALDEDLPEQAEDKTVPRYRQIAKRAGQYVIDWGTELEKQYSSWFAGRGAATKKLPVGMKREAPEDGAGNSKRVKSEPAGGDMTEAQVRLLWETNDLSNLRIPQLKAFAASKGVSASGKKAEIIDSISRWFQDRNK